MYWLMLHFAYWLPTLRAITTKFVSENHFLDITGGMSEAFQSVDVFLNRKKKT